MKRLSLPQAVALLLCVSLLSTVVLIICSSDLGSGGTTQPQQQQHRTPRERLRSALNVVRTAVNHTSAALACRDSDGSCASWARTGECSKNAKFMNVSCKRSCGLCPSILGGGEAGSARPRCEDASSFCGQWAAVGECDSNPLYMRHNCPVTCHLCQSSRCHDVDTQSCAAQARALNDVLETCFTFFAAESDLWSQLQPGTLSATPHGTTPHVPTPPAREPCR